MYSRDNINTTTGREVYCIKRYWHSVADYMPFTLGQRAAELGQLSGYQEDG